MIAQSEDPTHIIYAFIKNVDLACVLLVRVISDVEVSSRSLRYLLISMTPITIVHTYAYTHSSRA